jgi:hypothetical protein
MSVTRLNQQRVDFYVGLLDDLLDIVERLETCGEKKVSTREGAVIAKVEMSGFSVQIGMEYFIYINTYGIPEDGVFEEEVLERIRNNMPLPRHSGCGGCRKIVCCCSSTCAPPPCAPPAEDPSGCQSACHSCYRVVCCCSSGCGGGCTDCSGNDTTTEDTPTQGVTPISEGGAPTNTSPNGTDRIDNDTAGNGELGIVILE